MAIPITQVRYDEETGREVLRNYVFGGRFVRRPPRGVSPELVSTFVREELKPDSSFNAWRKTADLLRFYERSDVMPHVVQVLRASEAVEDDLRRSCYALQIVGDLGTPEQAAQAAGYFDRVIAPHPHGSNITGLLMETAIAMTAPSSVQTIAARLTGEIQHAAQTKGMVGPEGATYRRLVDTRDIELMRTRAFIDEKRRIAAMPPDMRRRTAIWIYIGESDFGGPQMQVWAARLIRAEAIAGPPEPVHADLAVAIDSADPARVGKDTAEFIVHRAAQAVIYLQGKLTWAQRSLYNQIEQGPENFLWDDLPQGEIRE